MGNFYNPYSSKWKAGTKEGNKWKAENAPSLHIDSEDLESEYDSEKDSSNKGGIIGIDGNPIKFRVHSKGYVKIKSNNADAFTEKYLNAMALTEISQEVLLEIRDGDKKIQIKDMTQKENDVLIEGKPFDYISAVTLAKEQYHNLQSYIIGQITKEDYHLNDEIFKAKALSVNGNFNESSRIGRVEQIKLEQYLEQIILINDNVINTVREFFATTLEESIHSLQDYIEAYYKSDNKNSYTDYLDLRHEKEAKVEVDKALKEYDEI